jgi:LPS-assembly protein
MVRSVNLGKEKEGSSIQVQLLRPVTYQVVWIEDLSQLLVTVLPREVSAKEPSVGSVSVGSPQRKGKELQVAQAAQSAGRDEEEEIKVTADQVESREKGAVIEAKGNVEVRRGETTFKAEELKVKRVTKEMEAKGNVSVDSPEWRMKADAFRLNLEQETGEIEEGEVFIEKGNLSLSGKRFQKFTGQVYHIDEGAFTTCLCEDGPPSWRISAEEMDLSKEGAGTIKGGTFHVLDIPVFYLPYGYFPLRTERQSGFLFPSFGSSSKEGFRFQQPFFWAISKSTDATINFNIESRARVGGIGEIRKIFSQNTRGRISAAYFNESLRDGDTDVGDPSIADPGIPKNRWGVAATHRNYNPSGWITYSNIVAFSDDLFTRELYDKFDLDRTEERNIRTSRFGRSRFGFFKSWDDIYLRGEWDFYQDFIQEDEITFQGTPKLSFWGRRVLGKTPLELGWRVEGVNYWRDEGADGLRFDLRPQITLPFRLPPYLFGSLNVAPRETLYHLHDTSPARDTITELPPGGKYDRNNSRELVELSWNVGTSVGRVFSWNGSALKKIKHVIEPEISYLFIPDTNQEEIPIMDGTDRINRRNLLTFSLTNRLWGKSSREPIGRPKDQDVELLTSPGAGEIREMGRLRLALSYDIDKERNGGDSLSDLDMNLRLTPVDYFTLRVDTGLNPGPWQLTQAAVGFLLSDPRPLGRRVLDRDFRRPNQLGVIYRFIREDFLAPLAENANLLLPEAVCPPGSLNPLCDQDILEQVTASTLYHLTDHLLLLYDSNYDAREGRFTSNRAGIKILSQCECWSIGFSVNHTRNPDRTSFKFGFNLLGLGS